MSYGAEEYGSSEYGGALTEGDMNMSAVLENEGTVVFASFLLQKPLAVLIEGVGEAEGSMTASYVMASELNGDAGVAANMVIIVPKARGETRRQQRGEATNEFLARYTIKKRGE